MLSLIDVCGIEIKVSGKLIRIARIHGDKYKFIDDPEPIIESLKKLQPRIDLFTFMQRLPDTSPKFAYPIEWDNLAVLRITTYEQWWTKQIDNKTRNMVRRAEKKGIVVREVPFSDVLVEGIWRIYNETPIRQGKLFPHYGKDLKTVHWEEATHLDSGIFIGAFYEEQLVGFMKLVFDEVGMQAGIMNLVSLVAHRDKAPTNALIAQAVRSSADRGHPYLVYASFAYGKKQGDSLSDFKRNNGFEKVDMPRYYIPVSTLGHLVFRLGLHHSFYDYIPESAAVKFRKMRNAWYSRKFQAAKQV